ncbi:MAG: hypothetical protein MMC23_004464 [Stictis urceolatum]|nr:hypothetical protein [Stictis urceolata]
MDVQMTPYNLGLAACALLAVGVLVRFYMLPRPIPGIPYHKASAKRILGDMPDLIKYRGETKEIWGYIRQLAIDLDTPIFQMFMRPLGKPWVVITDFRESADIQQNRQNEFDRSTFIKEVFGPLLPGNHVWMQSNDEFRAHRHLIRDTMSPGFLGNVVGPAIHESTQELLKLWKRKSQLAEGRPFQADKDIIRNLVDVIIKATFGFYVGAIAAQATNIAQYDKVEVPSSKEEAVVFPAADDPEAYTSVRLLVDSLEIAMRSPLPRQHLQFALGWYPSLVKARKWNEDMMGRRLDNAWKTFSANTEADDQVKSAVDLLVQREAQMAKREGRDVMYDTRVIRDELFGFFAAGHETTSTTICWAVKYLTQHQEVQRKLRAGLRAAHKRAATEGDLPTAHEIVKTDVPYLDAFIEENHRWATSIPAVIRIATKDTVVLGHHVPMGTDVFMLNNGPSFQTKAFEIDEHKRSQTSQDFKDKYGNWEDDDIGNFRPERWLVEDEKGNVSFNPKAGPILPYGFGLRGCFGTKLAVLELKVIITMIAWSFDMQPLPDHLNSFKADDTNTHRVQQCYLRLADP